MPQIRLLDNSAWARSIQPGGLPSAIAHDFAADLVARRLATCTPFRLEASYSARNEQHFEAINRTLDQLPSFELSPEAQARAHDCHAQLVSSGHHRVPPTDLLIAAVADIEGLGIVHYDADYDLILEFSNLRFESHWVAPRGSL